MEIKQVSLNFDSKFENVEKINDEFTKVKIRVQGVGKNRNMSYMSKENIEKNLSTLPYCPVVGHLIEKEDGTAYMGGHDEELILTEKGIKFKSLTVPFGVVCKDSFDWEDVQEYGETVTYLTTEAFLWTKRYDSILDSIYSKDVWFGQSMELSVSQYRPYEDDSNYTELLDWNYSALCLLGKSDNKNSEEHTEPCFISSDVKPFAFSINEEFSNQMEEIKKQLAFYFDNLKNVKMDGGEKMTEENIQEIVETPVVAEVETIEDNSVEQGTIIEENVDCQLDVVEKAEYIKLQAELIDLQNQFELYKQEYAISNSEVEELKQFKSSIIAEEHKSEVENILSEFADLKEIEEFKTLSEKAIEFNNIDDLKKECYAIRGKNLKVNFAKNSDTSKKAPLNNFSFDETDDGFGGILANAYVNK